MNIRPHINSFIRGELSPLVDGRFDAQFYNEGASIIENYITYPSGAISRRPGTVFVCNAAIQDKNIRLIPYIYDREQTFIIELSPGQFRISGSDGSYNQSFISTQTLVHTFTDDEIMEIKYQPVNGGIIFVHRNHPPSFLSDSGEETNRFSFASMVFKFAVWDQNVNYLKGSVTEYPGESGTHYIKNKITDESVLGTTPDSAGEDWITYDSSNPDHPKMNPFDSVGNYPGALTLHEGRLVFGGTINNPLSVWASASNDIHIFLLGSNASDPWEYGFNSVSGDYINWIESSGNLIVGTNGGEWKISGGELGIIPGQVYITKQTNFGSSKLQGKLIGSSIMFFQRSGEKLRNYIWQSEEDAFRSTDLTMISDHITQGGIIDMAVQMSPMSILWMVRADGQLVGATLDFNAGSIGWHRHPASNGDKVLSVCVTPTDTVDRVWIVLERTLSSGKVRTLEYFDYIDPWKDQEDYHFVDSGVIKKSETTFNTVENLDHLNGMTVQVIVDGYLHPDKTVEGGEIKLESSANSAHVGLEYQSRLRTVRISTLNETGTLQGQAKKISKITVRFFRSLLAKAACDDGDFEKIDFSEEGFLTGEIPPLFTGDKTVTSFGGFAETGYVTILQDKPFPSTILAIIPHISV